VNHSERRIEGTSWPRLVLGLVVVFSLFHLSADALGSDRGQAGLVVGVLVVAATLLVEYVLFGVPPVKAVLDVGLGRPRSRGILVATVLCVLLLVVFPIVAAMQRTRLALDPQWALLLPGLFAQGGIAEEVLFRGYLFRRVRAGRSFWRAAVLAGIPFVAVHLILFFTLPWPIALAAVLLSAVLSAPFAHLFELGGNTIWAPTLAHFTIQGAIKIISLEEPDARLPIIWMAASAVLPFLVFLVPRPTRGGT
jgi:membrane protease YdiL (CAAX protease family)